jgi:ribosomal protein S18 acetylase RimI-like enzyme
MNIISLTKENREPVDQYIRENWAGPMLVTLGNLFDSRDLPGFLAVDGDEVLGAVLYKIGGKDCEIASLFSLAERRGAGTALIDRVVETARTLGCGRVFLITTNDNTHAIRFYQKYGFSLKAVHIGSLNKARVLKSSLPEFGIDGIRLEHEFEFEIQLS